MPEYNSQVSKLPHKTLTRPRQDTSGSTFVYICHECCPGKTIRVSSAIWRENALGTLKFRGTASNFIGKVHSAPLR